MARLGDVLEFAGTPERINRPAGERFVTVRMNGGGAVERLIRDGKTPVPFTGYRVKSGQLIYSRIDARNGAFAIVPPSLSGSVVSKDFPIFDVRHDRVNSAYLWHFFRAGSLQRSIQTASAGATNRQRISEDRFLEFRIPLPPLEEQCRIAAILDRADALRAKRREVLARLSTLTQSILADVLSSEESSAKVRVGDVCTRVTDGTHQSPSWTSEGIPFLFVSNITSGEIDFNTTRFISSETWHELTRNSPIECGDVLYSSVGSYGNPVVVRTSSPFAFQRHIAHLKPKRSVLQSDFFAAQLDSQLVRNQARRAAKGIAQPTVNLSDIRQFEIRVPSLKVQNKFAELSAVIRAERGRMLLAQATETALFASLQARAFRGEL
jgi:type I restriction enzyme S subunit